MEPLKILSMGWGVQTWTLAAMIALDEYPRPDIILFADTQHESQGTYEFIRQWEPWLGEHGLSVVTVQGKRTADMSLIPFYTLDKEGKAGQVHRQCTSEWKISPIRRFAKEELMRRGLKPTPGAVESWQGISLDEFERMRDSDVKYVTHAYPLIERRMTRMDCITWLESHNLPVAPKSACTFCPFTSTARWKEKKRLGGADWAEAVMVDEAIRNQRGIAVPGMTAYVHTKVKPLPMAIDIPEDHGAHQTEMDMGCDSGYCMI